MDIGVIIPAAGQGSRMQKKEKKQFLLLHGKPILAHTLDLFVNHPHIEQILLMGSKEDMDSYQKLVEEYVDPERVEIISGGETRSDTVWRGLQVLKTEYVLIHDGARPLLPLSLLNRIIEEMERWDVVTPALPILDTVKTVSQGLITGTIPREGLRVVQTPQAFCFDIIYKAYSKRMREGFRGTDDISFLEGMNYAIRFIPGSQENIKITIPEDLLWGEMILRDRKRRESL